VLYHANIADNYCLVAKGAFDALRRAKLPHKWMLPSVKTLDMSLVKTVQFLPCGGMKYIYYKKFGLPRHSKFEQTPPWKMHKKTKRILFS
jgi:hypothetical protein